MVSFGLKNRDLDNIEAIGVDEVQHGKGHQDITLVYQLDPIKKFVKTVRNHQELMMNWFKAKKQYSSGTAEGLNRIVNLVTRKAFGFRQYETLEIVLFHTMGKLPEPKSTHSFF